MKTITCILALVLLSLGDPAGADWDTDDKAKWLQMPDLTAAGSDVNASLMAFRICCPGCRLQSHT